MRAIDHPLGLTAARLLEWGDLAPWDLQSTYMDAHRRAGRASELAGRKLDRGPERLRAAKHYRESVAEGAPLCACGCGLPVRSRCSGVWSQYRGNHWRRRGS